MFLRLLIHMTLLKVCRKSVGLDTHVPAAKLVLRTPCWISMLGNDRETMLGQDLGKRWGNGKDTDAKV